MLELMIIGIAGFIYHVVRVYAGDACAPSQIETRKMGARGYAGDILPAWHAESGRH